jgi:hypothetical protein
MEEVGRIKHRHSRAQSREILFGKEAPFGIVDLDAALFVCNAIVNRFKPCVRETQSQTDFSRL